MDSLRDRVHPVTQRSNANECNVTFERYCSYICSHSQITAVSDWPRLFCTLGVFV